MSAGDFALARTAVRTAITHAERSRIGTTGRARELVDATLHALRREEDRLTEALNEFRKSLTEVRA